MSTGTWCGTCLSDVPFANSIPAWHYRQFDADFTADVPAEGYGGWNKSDIPWCAERTALVVMHAWDTGTREQFPGWHRAVEYIPRAERIAATTLRDVLDAFRNAAWNRVHVTGGGNYYQHLPGFRPSPAAAGNPLGPDPHVGELHRFRAEHVFVGRHNENDVRAGFAVVDFPEAVRPRDDEAVVDAADALDAWCRENGVRHLIYSGFALNWCLLMSPGGMIDMSRRGYVCSAVRDASTSVENKESARIESHHEEALWRVALAFGFVFETSDLLSAARSAKG
jgi:nicotinamidase-related amidase